MNSGAVVLAALGAIGLVIWHSMLQVLQAEGGADGRYPQVCSTAVSPMRAPRCFGSAAIVISVCDSGCRCAIRSTLICNSLNLI